MTEEYKCVNLGHAIGTYARFVKSRSSENFTLLQTKRKIVQTEI